MRKTSQFVFISFLLLLAFSIGLRSKALAQTVSPTPRVHAELHQDLKALRQTVKEEVKDRTLVSASPSGVKERCELHLTNIKVSQIAIADEGQKLLDHWEAVTAGVENYYTTILLPSGKTVANYDALTADVTAKKDALVLAIEKVKTDADSLSCDTGDAKTQFKTFRSDWQSLLTAVQAYRKSIRTLFVAIKAVARETHVSVSPSPSAGVSPTASGGAL